MLVIGPGLVFAPQGLQPDAGVACDGGKIVEVGPFTALKEKFPDAEILDAKNGVILPGLINAHSRLCTIFATGMAPEAEPHTARDWYERVPWQTEAVLTADDIEIGARLGLIAAAKAGVTTLIEHHSSPQCVDESLDIIADQVEDVGLRACLCHDVSDRYGEATARAAIAENLRFVFAARKRAAGRVRGVFGLHASSTLGQTTANRFQTICFVAGPNIVTHLSLGEDPFDGDDARRNHGFSGAVERLANEGALSKTTLAAHVVNVSDPELDYLASAGVRVVHMPRLNQKLGVGRARIEAMLARNMIVGLGTGGVDGDMLAEMKAAAMTLRHATGTASSGIREAQRMLFEHNPQIAAAVLPDAPSGLVANAPADVAVLDYQPLTPLTPQNFTAHLFDAISSADVAHTVCAGRIVMRDRKMTRVDEQETVAQAREAAARIWQRATQSLAGAAQS